MVYAELNDGRLRAIVMGSRPYEVECNYDKGEIYAPMCNCFCTGICKHQVAALLQLRETMKDIGEEYGDDFDGLYYFAMMPKDLFYERVLAHKKSLGIKLD